ncbi:effector-associated constant component EACC1 [Amycolatopsis sp. lyj-112]|uniref:effector-associated constant component EACC1 n=1 Tax=Amycolatopsis sp. lyj-112 TaxID=2789288 RepID=UPI00397BCD2D
MVDALVTAEAQDVADELRSLHGWLTDVQELKGAVGLRESPPPSGALGPLLDALVVALGPAGAATAFATTVIAWLRLRRGDVHIKVTLDDGRSAELSATKVSELDTAALERQVKQLAEMLGAALDETKGIEGK